MEIQKVLTGIAGFDQISRGGLPRHRTTLLLGGPGSGKTVFALQTLVNRARNGDPAVFVAFEEPTAQVRENAAIFDWSATSLSDDKLAFIDANLSPDVVTEGDFDFYGLLAVIKARVGKMNAKIVVFDGLDVLLTLLPDENAQRREIYRIRQWLAENSLTGILTAKIEDASSDQIQVGFLQYVSDCVVLLTNVLSERVSSRTLRVIKYRGSGHSTNQFGVIVSSSGLEVEGFLPDEMVHEPSDERISTGVPQIDSMLEGGYYRGSCVLISGVPGAAKTTLAAAAAYACCERGEPVVFASFEDAPETMVRNLKTVGMDFDPFIDKGLMSFHAVRSTRFSTEQHLVNLKLLVEQHRAKTLVVDPVSALLRSSGTAEAEDAGLRLIDFARSSGITLIITSLPVYAAGTESTPMEVSTMADVWLHVEFVRENGTRRRHFSVLKARGTDHSEQVMQLEISREQGIRLNSANQAKPARNR